MRCADCGRYCSRRLIQYATGSSKPRCADCMDWYDASNPKFIIRTFRRVAKGKYSSGPRKGDPCVVKWFKTGAVFADVYYSEDLKAVDAALEIVNWFNEIHMIRKVIKINIPEVWGFEEDEAGDDEWNGQKCLIEPFIENYQKFNSNSGWNDDSTLWGQVMQALSHFSYHITSGNFLLCDIQGGVYKDDVVLSDPVILSRSRKYGVTDLGRKGIRTFFKRHNCNQYCDPEWILPSTQVGSFPRTRGTTMISRVVTRSTPVYTRR